jgi:hypothetical protein
LIYSEFEIPYTGNAAADSLLYHYAGIAKEKKISDNSFDGIILKKDDLCFIYKNIGFRN